MNNILIENRNLKVGMLIMLLLVSSAFVRKKPRVLIIGDSISIGYTPFVEEHFGEKAIVEHNPGNAQHTGTGLKNIKAWIGDGNWDVVQFNWGLWDLCYRHSDSKVYGNRDKVNGKITYPEEVYEANLDSLVTAIKQSTDAKLIFVTTTYVPSEEPGRNSDDVMKYNDAAKRVMRKHNVMVNDIYERSIPIHTQFGMGNNDVHYTSDGYEQLSKHIIDCLSKELKLKNRKSK